MFLALPLLAHTALALDPTRRLTQYVLTNWQAEQGLPQSDVLSIARTGDGYLWIGTQEGLARFDGVQFTVFNHMNTPELQGLEISALSADSLGRPWIATDEALVLYERGKFKRLREGTIRAIAQDHNDGIWIGSTTRWVTILPSTPSALTISSVTR